MDFESDEMFKLLKFKMSDWANASRIAQVAATVAQPAQAGLATKAAKGGDKKKADAPKGGAGAAEQVEEKKVPTYEPDTTPAGQKKDMTKPMANEYIPK